MDAQSGLDLPVTWMCTSCRPGNCALAGRPNSAVPAEEVSKEDHGCHCWLHRRDGVCAGRLYAVGRPCRRADPSCGVIDDWWGGARRDGGYGANQGVERSAERLAASAEGIAIQ